MFSEEIKEKIARLGGNWMTEESFKDMEGIEDKESWDPLKNIKSINNDAENNSVPDNEGMISFGGISMSKMGSFCVEKSPKKEILFGNDLTVYEEDSSQDDKRYFLEKAKESDGEFESFKKPFPVKPKVGDRTKNRKDKKRLIVKAGNTILRDESVTTENLQHEEEPTLRVVEEMDRRFEYLGKSERSMKFVMGRICGGEVREMLELMKKKREREDEKKRERWV